MPSMLFTYALCLPRLVLLTGITGFCLKNLCHLWFVKCVEPVFFREGLAYCWTLILMVSDDINGINMFL